MTGAPSLISPVSPSASTSGAGLKQEKASHDHAVVDVAFVYSTLGAGLQKQALIFSLSASTEASITLSTLSRMQLGTARFGLGITTSNAGI